MSASLYTVIWVCCLVMSIGLLYVSFGSWGLTQMFPEGRKWWDLPLRTVALIVYATVIHFAPDFF